MRNEELESDNVISARRLERRRGVGRPFARGQSGNPTGRPPRRAATGAPGDLLPGCDQPTRSVILREAYRMVTVGEGDKVVQMPAHEAVFRALTEAALSGSQIAQRRWTAMVQVAELEQLRDQLAIYNAVERPKYPAMPGDVSYDDEIILDPRSRGVVFRPVREGA